MKKNRLLTALLTLVLTFSLFTPYTMAQATQQNSEILDSMEIEATAAILVDVSSGTMEILYEQNAYDLRYPASITKVMSALLTVEAIDEGRLSLDDIITVGPEVSYAVGAYSSTQNIKEGEMLTLRDVLYCALTASANEACNVLAQAVSGDVYSFLELMNQRAAELGMENTHYCNTHGYHDDDHYTTAYDIALLCQEAMSHPLFAEIASTVSYLVPATNMSDARQLYETNALVSNYRYVGYYYPYATGIKTGSTTEAGLCLASSATKDGRDLIAVVLGASREEGTTGSEGYRQFSESVRLLEFGFANFGTQVVLDSTSLRDELPVTLSQEANYVGIEPVGSIEAMLPNDLDPLAFTREVVLFEESLVAPVSKGTVLGSVTVSNGDTVYGTLDLVAVSDVERSDLLYYLDCTQQFFSRLEVKIGLAVLGLLIVILIVRLVLGSRGRSARRSSGYRGGRRR